MRNIDTLFSDQKEVMPLRPFIIESSTDAGQGESYDEALSDAQTGEVRVQIFPGFVVCPNLKQKFTPIKKIETIPCKVGDGIYLVIDGNFDSIPISIKDISIKRGPKREEKDPKFVLLAEIRDKGTISNFGGFFSQIYLFVESSISDEGGENEKITVTTTLQ
jgi:hypothetical protein